MFVEPFAFAVRAGAVYTLAIYMKKSSCDIHHLFMLAPYTTERLKKAPLGRTTTLTVEGLS